MFQSIKLISAVALVISFTSELLILGQSSPNSTRSLISLSVGQNISGLNATLDINTLGGVGGVINPRAMNWNEFQTGDTIFRWMTELSVQYPIIARNHRIGFTYHERPILVMEISVPRLNSSLKRGIFIDATTGGVDWLSTGVATYIINELVTNSQNYATLLEKFNFYILPIVNPDGYFYAHSDPDPDYRGWVKNLSPSDLNGRLCYGVDLDKNLDYEFGTCGVDLKNHCAEEYQGPTPVSEYETMAIKRFVMLQNSLMKWTAYFKLQDYGPFWLTPYGLPKQNLPDNYDELIRIAEIGAAAIKQRYNTNYKIGTIANVSFDKCGGYVNWFKDKVGARFVYKLQLAEIGDNYPPPSKILPTAEETWDGIQAALLAM